MSKWLTYGPDGQQIEFEGMDVCRDCDYCGGVEKTDCDLYIEGVDIWLRINSGVGTRQDMIVAGAIQEKEPEHLQNMNWFGQAYIRYVHGIGRNRHASKK